jgi:arginase
LIVDPNYFLHGVKGVRQMTKQSSRTISIVGVPLDLGSGQVGSHMGPNAIRSAGIIQRLELLGYQVEDEGDLFVRRPSLLMKPKSRSKLKFLNDIVRVNRDLCQKLSQITANGHLPLVLGGDHSIAIGTLAGLSQQNRKLGLIWFDAHCDVNTPETTPSGNIHGMSLAVSLGIGNHRLTGIGGEGPKVKAEHTVVIGARSVDYGEREFLKKLGVSVFTSLDIERFGMAEVMKRALSIAADGTDGVHLSFDLDGLDPLDAPGVGTPIPAGVSLRESLLAMEMISDAGVMKSAEFVEVNPLLDHRNRTAKVAVELISTVFGEKIIL